MKARSCAALITLLICASCAVPISAQDGQWWDDSYNFRIPLLGPDGETIVDFSSIMEELGLYDLGVDDIGRADIVDIDSLRVVSHGASVSEKSFEWVPIDPVFVERFDSDLSKWSLGTDVAATIMDKGGNDALRFSKSTDTGVKLYARIDSQSMTQNTYLSFHCSGSFRITLRDPGKGTFLLDELLDMKEYTYLALPLNFETFRDGIDYYLEIYPSDITTYNWIDDIALLNEAIGVAYSPNMENPYLYFNTFLSKNEQGSIAPTYELENIGEGEVGKAEGFRIAIDQPVDATVGGDVKLQVRVLDPLNEIEWVRYRLDWPSCIGFDQYQYGIWGDFMPVGGVWMATWDTISTIADGHHTIAVMAKDVEGIRTFQMMEVEVDNILADTALFESVDSFSFAVIGDTQPVAGGGIPNPYVASVIMQSAAEDEIDFAIQVGDLTYSGHKIEYEQVRYQLDPYLSVPMYAVAGNHDAAASDGLENFVYDYGDLFYSFDYGNSHFIFLCSELDGQKGLIIGNQLTWLEAELAENADKEHIFVTVHQPIYPYYHGLENQEEIQQILEEHENITAIFQGHEHTYFHEMVGDTHNFVTGGATWLDSQYPVENTFNHYFIITVDGSEMTWETIVPSFLSVDSPYELMEVTQPTIEVSGYTQPYTNVTVQGQSVTSDVRGYYAASVPVEYGNNEISVETSDLPDGVLHSETVHVWRLSPLAMEYTQDGNELTFVVTSQGTPVEGAIVSVEEEQLTTGSDGSVTFGTYPDIGTLKVSAAAQGYSPAIDFIEPVTGGSSTTLYVAAVVIVVILIGALYAFMRKK